ncbi:MAG: PAS domain S-box protein [Proteobacteria bacterium]|nr:PAS domain S-box protein [Pseudomonadota bacterium]
MTLSKKTYFIVCATFIGLIAVLSFVSSNILWKGFDVIENDSMRNHVERILSTIDYEYETLVTTVGDYAGWDETYAFVQNRNDKYIKVNMDISVFSQLRLNAVIILNRKGEVVYSTGYDHREDKQIPLSPEIMEHFRAGSFLVSHDNIKSSKKGILPLKNGGVILASHPILTSTFSGPIMGTLIMGRDLDEEVLRRWSKLTRTMLSLQPLKYKEEALPAPSGIAVKNISPDITEGYTQIPDVYGKPAYLLSVRMPRHVHQQAQKTIRYLAILTFMVFLVFALAIIWLLKKSIIIRLVKIGQDVNKIGMDADFSARISVAGEDELTGLGSEINGMIEKLEESTRQLTETHNTLFQTNRVLFEQIEEKKQSETALRKSEEKYRLIFEYSPLGLLSFDEKGVILACNDNFVQIIGSSREVLISLNMLNLPDKNIVSAVRKALSGSTGLYEDVYHSVTADKVTPVRALFAPMIVGDGLIPGGVGIIEDITDRKRAEDALHKSEEKYRLIADNMADAILVTDMNLRYTYVSPSVMRLSGFTVEEVMEQIPEQTMTIESSRIIYKTYEEEMKLEASGKANPKRTRIMELEIYRKDGSTFRAELSLSFLRDTDQKPIGILSVTRDITERKCAEDALRESERKYRLVLEANPDPMIVYDIEGKVIYLNPAFTSVFGWSLEERIGKKMDDFVPDESWPETRMMIDMVIAGKDFSGIETIRLTREGKMVPVSISGSCYRNQEGNIEASVINLRDITESKRVEAEKKKLEEQYKQAQKMEAIGQLAGGVAHDFNNMLNIILGYSQLALINLEPSNPLNANLQEIINAARRSADLVRQLLAFARKQTIEPKVLDLNDTVMGMLNMLRKLIGENIDLFWSPAANLWPVKMDPSQIDQIMANLAVNARDSISGVGKITIETGNAEFDDSYCTRHVDFVPGHYAMLAVSDNGCGMDKDTCEKIFEPFFTTKEVGRGTGLGLATVYGIVKQNNGLINVYSEPGKGTTFKIYLPRHWEDGSAIDEPRAHAEPLTGTETVLLVEDNEALLKMAEMMLEGLGYKVLTAVTPNGAIQLVGQYTGDIHLLLTDVVMPEMSGRDLQKRLTALRPGMKYLFMSGYTADVIAHRGILDEGVNFLQKPFQMEALATKVREALE